MNTKPIPAIVMLLAGFCMCMISIINGYSLSFLIRRLLFVLIGFYILGCVIKIVLDANSQKDADELTADDLGFADGEILEDIEVSEEEMEG